jgi:hypothetical protein
MHPSGKHHPLRLVRTVITDFDERRCLRRLTRRRRIAIARGDGKGGELDRHADGRKDIGRPPSDLVEAAQNERALDAVPAGNCVVQAEPVLLRGRRSSLRKRRRTDQHGTNGESATHERYRRHLPPELP